MNIELIFDDKMIPYLIDLAIIRPPTGLVRNNEINSPIKFCKQNSHKQ